MPNVMEIWDPLGHTGPVTGLVYLYLYLIFVGASFGHYHLA